MSGRLDSIAEWLKNNTEHFSEYNYVRVNPTDTDGYFGASSFDILWNLSSVNYGWIMLRSDNQKSVIFGRLVSGNAEWDIPAFKSDLDLKASITPGYTPFKFRYDNRYPNALYIHNLETDELYYANLIKNE